MYIRAIVSCRCGCGDTGRHFGHGYIGSCYKRWVRAGRPDTGPPPPPDTTRSPWIPELAHAWARLDNYRFLLSQGVHDRDMLARRLGCTVRHVERLAAADRALQQQDQEAAA